MHESAIVEYAVRAVEKSAALNGITTVKSIRLTIGKQRGAFPHALRHIFQIIIVRKPVFSGCELIIDEVPTVIQCGQCRCRSELEDMFSTICPLCGSSHTVIMAGNELQIASFSGI